MKHPIRTKLVFFAALAMCFSVSLMASNYYVSPTGNNNSTGTATSPWRTIQYASSRAIAGDTVHVLPGTYNESVQVISAGGTATAPINFVSDSRGSAKIRGVGTLPVFQVRQGDYIGIYGFDISGGGYQGIEIYSSYTRVVGNYVHDIPGGCPVLGGAGISTSMLASHDNLIDGNIVYNIRNATGACLLTHGIYTSNVRTTITNNIVFLNQGWGIQMWHGATKGTIANNTVFNNDAGGIVVGAVAAEVADGTGLNDYTVVSNNIIAYNGAVDGRYGIYESGATGIHNIYVNNIVWHNLSTEGSLQHGTPVGIIWKDPLFVNYQPNGSGDYRVRSTSPAVGAGILSAPTNPNTNTGISPDHDVTGYARPKTGAQTIGAFQYH